MARKTHRDRMVDVYERTLKNCAFYESEGMERKLLNEIGVLRGVAYCLGDTGNFDAVDARFVNALETADRLFKKEKLR